MWNITHAALAVLYNPDKDNEGGGCYGPSQLSVEMIVVCLKNIYMLCRIYITKKETNIANFLMVWRINSFQCSKIPINWIQQKKKEFWNILSELNMFINKAAFVLFFLGYWCNYFQHLLKQANTCVALTVREVKVELQK